MSTVVLYCWCHSDSASVLLYFTYEGRNEYSFILFYTVIIEQGTQRVTYRASDYNVPPLLTDRTGQQSYFSDRPNRDHII